jgi:vitamin B12 transporter
VAPSGTEKDGFDAKNITVNTKSKWDDGEIKTTLLRRESDTDLDNGTGDDLDYTADNKMNLYQLSGKVNNSLGFYNITFSRSEYDREYVNGTEIDEYDSSSNTVLLTNTIQKDKWDITPGVEYEWFDGSFINRGAYSASVDTGGENIGYFVNTNIMASNRLILSAGVRQDDPSLFDDYSTYRLGGIYNLTDALTFKSNYATSVRTPTLYEMHGTDNYGYNGNPDLLPEEANTTDVGFEFKFKDSVLDVIYFTTDLKNLITYGNSTYSNASGTSNRHGVEMKFNSMLTDNIYWRNNATFTVAEDGNGTQVTRRPKWTGLTAIDWNKAKWTTTAEYLQTGSHFDIDSATWATIRQPAVGIANVHTNYEINDKSNAILSINNISDKQYERPDGYAQQGRNILFTYKLKF